MNETITFCAWGPWAQSVLQAANPVLEHLDSNTIPISEETENISIQCPDPLSAEYYFSQRMAEDDTRRLVPSDFRIHVVHCGDNFATGALSSFIKVTAQFDQTYDVALLYIPPIGTNNATVGRFFSTLLANKNLFDVCALVDSCAPAMIDLGDDEISRTVSQIASLLAIFDRSGSVIPILRYMKTRIASFVFGSVKTLLAADFWELFVRNNSIALSPSLDVRKKTQNCLAFSVNSTVNKKIQYFFDAALGKNRFIFIPFLQRFEWKYQSIPSCFAEANESGKDFFCLINQNLIPPSIYTFLKDYYKDYWIENGKHTAHERLPCDSYRWLESLGISYAEKNNSFASLDELKTAKAFCDTN
ncbi:MAG: hypothetical protein IJU76_04100 [Desulfovibrionaceae bacterium]|nr:hypothetical protein [Desulfovibrionaceae bacterium]